MIEPGALYYAVLAGASLGFSAVGVGIYRRWALRHRVMDIPNTRSSHTKVTPRGGGLPLAAVILAGSLSTMILAGRLGPIELTYLGGTALMCLVGWLDDLHSLPWRVRIVFQLIAAVAAVLVAGYWRDVSLPLLGVVHLGWVGLPVTVVWIIGLTNAYNFMDGIDGIAGGQAAVAGLGWVVWGAMSGDPVVLAIGLVAAAASMGFLVHNWAPAKIFMGDVGSLALGYTFAFLPLLAKPRSHPDLPLFGLLLVWPFVWDATFTFIKRLKAGENVFAAHRSHLYQRLVQNGLSHARVSSLYILLALAGVILAAAWAFAVPGSRVLVLGGLPTLSLALWLFVRRRETAGTGRCNRI